MQEKIFIEEGYVVKKQASNSCLSKIKREREEKRWIF